MFYYIFQCFLALALPPVGVLPPMIPQLGPKRRYMIQQFDWGVSQWRYQRWLGEFEDSIEAWHAATAARLVKNVRVVEVQLM